MLKSEFVELKDGSKVVFIGHVQYAAAEDFPPVGTILTRHTSWLDDGNCVQFNYDGNGLKDYHFFYAEEVDFIKE